MSKILVNRAKCNDCGEVVTSEHRHDFKWCKCGNLAVDGGKDYLRRVGGLEGFTDLSEYEEETNESTN